MNLFCLLLEDVNDNIGEETKGDTIGNAVTDSHEHRGEETRNSDFQFVPLNLAERLEHQNADHDKNRTGCRCRNYRCYRHKQNTDCKADCSYYGSQTGTPSRLDTGCGLDIGGNVGSAENCTDGCRRCISYKCALRSGLESFSVHHFLDFRIAEEFHLAAGTDNGSNRIKHID